MTLLDKIVLGAYGIACVVCILVYGYDKWRAKVGGNRVSEKALLLFSFLGPVGAVLGVYVFHHKSSKLSYQLKLISILVISLGLWGWSFYQVFWKN
jgi:uncharacterized membrane protein YsdA (DUF1294 family)